jgi:secondary thiamine-phosphate synthase enzyme
MIERIRFRTTKDGVFGLTEQIKDCVKKSGVKSGLLCAFITHTTAALTVNSFWDPLGHEDIQDEIRRLIPTRVDFKHQHDTPEDAAGHVKSTLIGPSMTFIIENGELLLGHSQGIYFLEFDGPRNRECIVKILEEK